MALRGSGIEEDRLKFEGELAHVPPLQYTRMIHDMPLYLLSSRPTLRFQTPCKKLHPVPQYCSVVADEDSKSVAGHQQHYHFPCLASEFGLRLPPFESEHLQVRLLVADPLDGCSTESSAEAGKAPLEDTRPYAVLAARGTCPFGLKSANIAATYPNVSVVLIINTASDEPLAMGAEFDTASPPPPVTVLSVGNAHGEELQRRVQDCGKGRLVLDLSGARDESLDPPPGRTLAPVLFGAECTADDEVQGSCATGAAEANAEASAEVDGYIPRTTIATWRSKNESTFPSHWRKSRARLVKLHPSAQGWRHYVFDDADVALFVKTFYPEKWPVYVSFPYKIMRFDLFRLLAVHHYGTCAIAG